MTYLSKLSVSCLVIFIVCFSFGNTIAQNWTLKNEGMNGAQVTDLLVKGDTIFMATESHGDEMYISTDNGYTWQGFPQPDLTFPTSFILKQDTIFVASRKGVSYSVDNGLTWVLYNEGMGPAQIEDLLVVDETLFAATYQGLFRSTHRTKPWTKITQGVSESDWFTSITRAGDKLYGLLNNKLKVSSDDGISWATVESLQESLGAVLGTDEYIFAGGLDTLYVSMNGTFWSKVGTGLDGFVYVLVEKDGVVYAGTSSGLFRSNDNGVTFTKLIIPAMTFGQTDVRMIELIGNEILVSPDARGIYRSTNGTTWTESNAGLNGNHLNWLHQYEGTLYASGFFGTYRSSDGASNWELMNDGYKKIDALVTKNDSLIAQSWGYSYVAISTDDGQNWSYNYPGDYGDIVYMSRTNANIAIISTETGLKKLGKDTWQTLIPSETLLDLSEFLSDGDTYVAWGNGIYVSTDRGTNWNSRIAGLPYHMVDDMVLHKGKLYSCVQGNIFRSGDLGVNWEELTRPASGSTYSFHSDGTYLYASTTEGPFVSPDDGFSWMKIGDNSIVYVTSMMRFGSELLAATHTGLYSIVPNFTPKITSFSPTEGVVGTTVTIKGKYFASYAGATTVKFAGVTATVLEAYSDSLVVQVPEGAITGKIAVTVLGVTTQSVASFCLQAEAPVISGESGSEAFPLLSTDGGTKAHQWFLNGEMIEGETTRLLQPNAPGLYTARVLSGSCYSQTSETFCVAPLAPVISSEQEEGEPLKLRSNTPSGNQWYYNGELIEGATTDSLLVGDAGAYTVKTSVGSCVSDISAVFCFGPPKPVITLGDVVNEFPTLNSNSGTVNQWFENGEPIPGVTGTQLLISTGGEYAVRTAVDVCWSELSDPACLLGTPTITAGDAGEVFQSLTSSSESGNQWFFMDEPIANGTDPVFQPTEPGPYTLQYATAHCVSEMSEVFCINPLKPTITLVDDVSTLVLTSNNADGNQWYRNGIAIEEATAQTFTISGSGSITLTTAAGGCESEPSLPFVVTDLEEGDASADFIVTPVPATEALYVDLASFGVHAPVDIQLYDNLGATHYHSPGLGGSKVHISLADVPAGMYYLQATQGVVRKVKRVIRK